MRRLLAVALLLSSSAAAAPTAEEYEHHRRILDFDFWNNRINEIYDIGELGRDGLPLLVYASDDADWQVRLTAAHFMGKLGPAAAPELAEIVRVEPCPRVRVSALRWLKGMGSRGKSYLSEVLTPEDEREMEGLPDRYGTEYMGKPVVIDAPDGQMTPQFFDHGLDLRVCASSEYANRRRRERPPESERGHTYAPIARRQQVYVPSAAAHAPQEEAPPSPDSFEPVHTPPIVKAQPRPPEALPEAPPSSVATIEPEAPAPGPKSWRHPAKTYEGNPPPAEAKGGKMKTDYAADARPNAPGPRAERQLPEAEKTGRREALPPGEPGAGPRPDMAVDARPAASPDLKPMTGTAPRRPLPPGESFPQAPAGVQHEAVPYDGSASVVADAGTGKPENDPLPELIRRLRSIEPRARARAADELGKRGAAALSAVPALRRALKDKDRRVRASAVLALGGVGGSVPGVVDELKRALRDKNEDVRFSALIALERLK